MAIPDIERIVAHDDFDGIVSAALCARALRCDDTIFAGPNSVTSPAISVGPGDAVCDLPYPLECGLWFDHHPGNRDELVLRGIDPLTIPGRFDERPSCARVILEYFSGEGIEFPGYIHDTVGEADMIDSFDYGSVEEWRRETPGKLVDMSIKSAFRSRRDRDDYLRMLVAMIREMPLENMLEDEEIGERIASYREEEEKMLRLVEESSFFLDEDEEGQLVILDLTRYRKQPRVHRNLAYLVHPDSLGVVSISSMFRGGRKTNDLSLSISLSMNLARRDHGKDAAEIMRSLNIGDGHAGAAGGSLRCVSKDAMLREKESILREIWELWKKMPSGGK